VKSGLRRALLLCVIIGSVGVVAAETGLISYTHFIYLAAENLLAISVVIAAVLAFTLIDPNSDAPHITHPAYIAGIVGVVSAAASVLLLLVYGGEFLVYEAIIALLMGVAVGLLSYIMLNDVGEMRQAGLPASQFLYALLALLLVITALLRVIAPGSAALTFVFAPILYFLLPGLALTFALLPQDSRLLEHVAYAAPISIGTQFIGVAWCVQLGIALTPLLFYITATLIILIGFAIALVRLRKP